MKNLDIKGYKEQYFIPSVHFDAKTGNCEISGESYLDDTAEFYEPIINWIKEYIEKVNKPLRFNFNLDYFNSSSYKRLYEILILLKDYELMGGQVSVNWYFSEDEHELVEEVDDLKVSTNININYHFS
jgi:hypothetical protein